MPMPKFNIHQLTAIIETLLEGEPVFIIRAQDVAAPAAVERYFEESQKAGGKNLIRSRRKGEEMKAWQEANPRRVKQAD